VTTVELASPAGARAVVDPGRGAAVERLLTAEGASLLSSVSKESRDSLVALAEDPCDTKTTWMALSEGGWEILAPNAGDAGRYDGRAYAFHGEVGRAPWTVAELSRSAIEMRTSDGDIEYARHVAIEDGSLTVRERVRSFSAKAQPFAWTSHLALGADAVTDDVSIEFSGSVVDGSIDGAADASGDHGVGARPALGSASFAVVDVEGDGSATLANEDLVLRVTWDAKVLPYLWVWVERGGTTGWPWFGRLHAIGLEPSNMPTAGGLGSYAGERTPPTLEAGESRECEIRLSWESKGPGGRKGGAS
jgi:hypothetical protein